MSFTRDCYCLRIISCRDPRILLGSSLLFFKRPRNALEGGARARAQARDPEDGSPLQAYLYIFIHHPAKSPSFPSLYLHAKLYLRFCKRATPTVTSTTPTTKMFKLTTASLLAVFAASVAAQSIPQYQSVSCRVSRSRVSAEHFVRFRQFPAACSSQCASSIEASVLCYVSDLSG